MSQGASVAPKSGAEKPFAPEQVERLVAWRKRFPYPVMGLLEALREVQGWHRRVSPEAEAYLAGLFEVSLHRVHELVTFYPYFTTDQTGRYRVEICRNLSCHLAGAPDMLRKAEASLGIRAGQTTPDGLFSLDAVECLGACEFAPAMSVNDELAGSATEASLRSLVAVCRQGKPLPPASLNGSSGEVGGGKVRVLTEHFGDPALHRLENYQRLGGYRALTKAKGMAPEAIMEEVKKSNLRGLGGAGFPSGMKWGTVPSKAQLDAPHYLVANADESEPGCFKDRVLMTRHPHALIEGLLIAGRAIDADGIYIFIRGEYSRQRAILQGAIDEAKQAGLLNKEIIITRGANTYISGCDTALLETMEGKKAWPRQPPPFPTVSGVMGHPTVVNNVETLMMLPSILDKGAEWFAGLGVPKSGGTAVFSVSGHVRHPGVYEFAMGTPLKDIIEAAGGLRPGRTLKAVIPGGTSTPVLTAAEAMNAKMDFDSLRAFGTFLGAGGVIVLDDTADMAVVTHIIERFLAHESCGQCTPCREGSGWVERILNRILTGGGVPEDLDNLLRIGENIFGKVICALGDTVGPVARTMIAKFRPDFEAHITRKP